MHLILTDTPDEFSSRLLITSSEPATLDWLRSKSYFLQGIRWKLGKLASGPQSSFCLVAIRVSKHELP
jgi:hypothetical protein